MTDTVLSTVDDGVATLTLNRPQALNSLTGEMADALDRALAETGADAAVRCVVVRGAGDHFMAGGDVFYFRECLALGPAQRAEAVGAVISRVHSAIRHLRAMGKPVIASVRGACAGFGVSLMAACDLAIAAEETTFSLAYCNIGITPDGGSTWFLPRLIGARAALELALLGDRFAASEAKRLNLVNRVVPGDQLETETAALARRLANGPTAALARAKRLIDASGGASLHAQLDAEERAFLEGVQGAEFEEGVRAFTEKRRPRFRG